MKIEMTDAVIEWFKDEYDTDGENFRFYVRYGGGMAGRIPGFSLGLNIETPENPLTSYTKDGVHFFIENSDAWYFDDKDLIVSLDEQLNEPAFEYR